MTNKSPVRVEPVALPQSQAPPVSAWNWRGAPASGCQVLSDAARCTMCLVEVALPWFGCALPCVAGHGQDMHPLGSLLCITDVLDTTAAAPPLPGASVVEYVPSLTPGVPHVHSLPLRLNN